MALEHIKFQSFMNISALLIIFGGTIGATMLSFPISQFMNFSRVLMKALSEPKYDPNQIISTLVQFAQKARREGLLALEQDVKALDNAFLRKGIELVVDGNDPELVRDILETQLSFVESRHKIGQSIFESMGGYSPTMGMIGTVAGLISVMSTLKDPSELGPKVALAFVATFFGISLANLFFLPIANKLKLQSADEVLLGRLMIEGILSVQAGDNPRIVEEKLKAFLSPKDREQIISEAEGEEAGYGQI
jgi:chemotaxis protein MotA